MSQPRSLDEINRLTGSETTPLSTSLERPARWPAGATALLAIGLLVYALVNAQTLFGRLLLAKDSYIPGAVAIGLLFVAEWLWLRD